MKIRKPVDGSGRPREMLVRKPWFRPRMRVMRLTPIDEMPEDRRGQAAETLVEYQLLKYGNVYRPPKGIRYIGDRLLEVEKTKVLVPVEVKKITRRSNRQIKIGLRFLDKFQGIYVVIIQRKNQPSEYDFLAATSGEMRQKVLDEKHGYLGKHDSARKTPRWHVGIPVSLAGWQDCLERWDKVTGFKPSQ